MHYPIIDVSNWLEDHDKGMGKGNREKSWLIDPSTGRSAMFKVPREGSGEHWAEKLCSEIAKVLDFKCAEVDIAIKNGVYGCLSYFFVAKKEGYSHFDGGTYFPFDYDDDKNIGYNIQLIKEVLHNIDICFEDFLFIVFFDALIANGDRHQDNWGITRHDTEDDKFISPLYDNSACLCRDIKGDRLDLYCSSKEKLLRFIYQGKSKIGWHDIRNQQHFKLIRLLTKEYPKPMQELFNRLNSLTDLVVDDIVNRLPSDVIHFKQKDLIKSFLKIRRDILVRIGDKMINNNSNKLYLVWKDPLTRQRYTIGLLAYNEHTDIYQFQYVDLHANGAIDAGFKNYPNFPNLTTTYEVSGRLFKDIKSRLPQPKRPDYAEILERYDLDSSSSDMEVLEATRGRTATDNFEFVRDFQYKRDIPYDFTFDLASVRYYEFENIASEVQEGDIIHLRKENDNAYDPFAVEVFVKGVKIGYVPRYYSKEFSNMIDDNANYIAVIEKLNKRNTNLDEWVQIRIKILIEQINVD